MDPLENVMAQLVAYGELELGRVEDIKPESSDDDQTQAQ